jgi:gamma-glutamyltranspeptidase / glutathione hydrolase
MKGAVAAGHPLTAQAGARILEEGGNAVDACIAAGLVSWVAESPLTGPGGGGYMLVHRARDRSDRVLDFFVAIPGRGLPPGAAGEMVTIEVPFDARTIQLFRIGAAACAVPGAVAGLAEAHRRYARLPWRELLAPAVEAARTGVELNAAQAFLHDILDVALRHEPEGRRIYGEKGRLSTGDRLVMEDLARTLEQLAAEGPQTFYEGELAGRIAAAVHERGGLITRDDLAAYRVIQRRPVRVTYRDAEFVSNPPPSAGGLLVAFALAVLDRSGAMPEPGSAEGYSRLAEGMRQAALARGGRFVSELQRGGAAQRLLAPDRLRAAAGAVGTRSGRLAREASGVPSTTHISVVDAVGNAASLSASTGCGSGVVVPGTGIQLNNMLGEEDLNPAGAAARPGRRLTSMMAPSVVLVGGRPRLVVGSAGSIRLRAAILQIVVNVIDHGMSAAEAISAPRIHLDGELLQLEGGLDPGAANELEADGYTVSRWTGQNLYFGGASAVVLRDSGGLEAAGDPRRGGAGVVVG